jgi:hypothetical protein
MKQNLVSKLVLSAVAVFGTTTLLFAGDPAKPKEETPAPKQYIQTMCETRGLFESTKDADGNELFICRLVANDFCFSSPCWVGMPVGNKPPVVVPVPQGIQIEEGQSFFMYKQNGVLKVVLTDQINGQLTEENGVQTITVSIGE